MDKKNSDVGSLASSEVKFSLTQRQAFLYEAVGSFTLPLGAMVRDSPAVFICPQIWKISYQLVEKKKLREGKSVRDP